MSSKGNRAFDHSKYKDWIDPKAVKPYERNVKKHDEKQIANIVTSIRRFGWQQDVVITSDNVLVIGHGRREAALRIGCEMPYHVIDKKADDLTEKDIRELRIADNEVNAQTGLDIKLLKLEIKELDFDGFDFQLINEKKDSYYGDARERTYDQYNLGLLGETELGNDFWQMPIIYDDAEMPTDLIGFNYAKSAENKACGVHFYIDDYQFERVWNDPQKYVEILKDFECVLSPDFSLYMDMPMPMKIWNIYRSRQIGAYWQAQGLNVIPTISWAEKETYKFCFNGVEKGSIVSVSTVGVKKSKDALKVWKDGMREMIKRLEPRAILLYGGKLDFDYGNIDVRCFDNKVTERMSRTHEKRIKNAWTE